jgi:hypothetical protein
VINGTMDVRAIAAGCYVLEISDLVAPVSRTRVLKL